ncbi:flagellar biosynthesis protein FlhF [Lentibacillus cibarius]|uniref:Flagellar biosynthesis protein FlhF n=1 Tax=Lentibacillus cibarius TaxID=2583219 RepID=A0A549YKK4_9BACI|nr:flagellar biosynthesis protein FlhF [Lentibacillus cibarius]TRM12416.1 flagellar biosynthesis protein FlhF [Lentibacillus cibarius]
MKVKKYVAPTMPEAMKKVRQEFGTEAVILNSREVKKKSGFLGLFKKRNIEVIAALDPQPKPDKKQEVVTRPAAAKNRQAEDHVISEIRQLKNLVKEQAKEQFSYPVDYQEVYDHLLNQEIDADLAKEIIDNVIDKHPTKNNTAPVYETIWHDTRCEMESRLAAVRFAGNANDGKVIQFVGPTGVGKTTTIAKVAASNVLTYKKRVALITADTYRIAAVEQLKTYASILNVPLKIAYNAEDYQTAIREFASFDLILVDTAGRNFRDEKYVQELKEIVHFQESIETYLVLSLTAKSNDIMEIYNQFDHLPIKKIIFTKADETRLFGSILNVALKKSADVAFITNGQDVPDDIIEASPEVISDYILGDYCDT